MGVQQVRVNDERQWQKDKAEDGDDDPVNRAEEVREKPEEDDGNAWKCYSQQRK